MVICLERDADLHMAQLMPLPLTVSCFSKIQIGFAFLIPAHPGSLGKRAVKWVCVVVWLCFLSYILLICSAAQLPVCLINLLTDLVKLPSPDCDRLHTIYR